MSSDRPSAVYGVEVHNPPPAELYHYTTLEGLRGIIQTNTIWATEIGGMNDSSELVVAKELLTKGLFDAIMLATTTPRSENPDTLALFASRWIEMEYKTWFEGGQDGEKKVEPLPKPMIASFCSHQGEQGYERQNGQLSQWRGYGPGGGYCLEFDGRELAALGLVEMQTAQWSSLSFFDVVYGHERDRIAELIGGFWKILETFYIRNNRNARLRMANTSRLGWEFVKAAIKLKHEGFKEEHEARFACIPLFSHINSRLHKRQIGSREVSYVALFEGLSCKLPVKRVIVGPSVHQLENAIKARRIVPNEIKITRSATPYIERF